MLMFQITQMSSISAVSVLTTVPIATQTPLASYFGKNVCYVYWAASLTYTWNLILSGIGMAIYRLLCFHYLFKRELNTKSLAKKILMAELAIMALMMSANAVNFQMFGWEKSIYYQYCNDNGPEHVEALHHHKVYIFKEFQSVLKAFSKSSK